MKPRMREGLFGGRTFGGVDDEELSEKVDESRVVRLDTVLERRNLGLDRENGAVWTRLVKDVGTCRKVLRHVCPVAQEMRREGTDDACDAGEESGDARVCKEDSSGVEFGQDASQRPDVDLLVVGEAEHHLWSAVRSGLDVGAEMIGRKARRSQVNHLHFASAEALDENVFGLQIAVDDVEFVDKVQRFEDLLCDSFDPCHREVLSVRLFSVVLVELVQVVSQQLCHNKQMLLVVKVIC